MKRLNPLRLGMLFAGCFLGAGYVSGQELWQFFGAYGRGGFFGIFLAVGLLYLFSAVTLRLVQMTGEHMADRVLVPWDIPLLRGAAGVLEVVFMFGVAAIMCAGVGALLEQLFHLPAPVGSGIMSAVVLLIALLGLRGVVSAFSVTVPVLVVCTALFGVLTVRDHGFAALPQTAAAGTNPLLGGWPAGAAVFACYNVFGSVGILIPFGDYIEKRRAMYTGLAAGAAALLIVALSVLLSVAVLPETVNAELPMLALAQNMGTSYALVYGALLVLAMTGTSVSSFVGLADYLGKRFSVMRRRTPVCVGLMLLVYPASLLGFGDLIGVLYPLFGYASALFLGTMLVHYIKHRLSVPGASRIRK